MMLAGTFDNNSHVLTLYSGSSTSLMERHGSGGLAGYALGGNTAEFLVGNVSSTPPVNYQIPAWIDNVRVYNRALSLSELEAIRVSEVPEPSTFVLLGISAFGLFAWAWRRRK